MRTDFEEDHVESTRDLVGGDVRLISETDLDFESDAFDVVVGINFLEHIEDDDRFISEMARVLKPGGTLVFTAPRGEKNRPGYLFKRAYGFTADKEGFGHARDGYLPAKLGEKFNKAGLEIQEMASYSRFFTEVTEDSLNSLYHRKASKGKKEHDFHGTTSPTSGSGFSKVSLLFRIYSILFPLIRAFTLLDYLMPFLPGYMLVCRATKVKQV